MDEDGEGATTEISRNRAETECGGREGAQEGEKSWTCEIRAKMKEREEKQEGGKDRGRRVESECSPLISPGVRVALPSFPPLLWSGLP